MRGTVAVLLFLSGLVAVSAGERPEPLILFTRGIMEDIGPTDSPKPGETIDAVSSTPSRASTSHSRSPSARPTPVAGVSPFPA
jgi:hypothetical protein